jgi:hypothetical protein
MAIMLETVLAIKFLKELFNFNVFIQGQLVIINYVSNLIFKGPLHIPTTTAGYNELTGVDLIKGERYRFYFLEQFLSQVVILKDLHLLLNYYQQVVIKMNS